MAKLLFQHPADNLATPDVTATPSSEDVAYPIENLFNGNPAKPFRFDALQGNVVIDFGVATQIDIFAVVMHNLDEGIDFRLQANDVDEWSTPSLDQVVTVGAPDEDGFPPNLGLDLTGIASRTFRYWRLLVAEDNSDAPAFGHLHLGAPKRSLVHNISWGLQEGVERTIVEHETDYYVSTIYDLGVKVRTFQGECETTDAGLAVIRQWWDACRGRALPTIIVPDPANLEPMLVRWAEIRRSDRREFKNVNMLDLAWREVSRGLVL